MDRAEAETKPEDVGDQALMRGLATACPLFVRGCLGLDAGVDREDRPRSVLRGLPCRGFAPAAARMLARPV